jgi:hypothetical protein
MKNEKQTKKQKHAAKSWDFKFRGGINGIDVAEIAETLSRKNPVAVVTLLPTEKNKPKECIVVIHHSLQAKCLWVYNKPISEYLLGSCPVDKVIEQSTFAYAVYEGENALDLVRVLINALEYLKNNDLPDKQEYTAAVNYPKV